MTIRAGLCTVYRLSSAEKLYKTNLQVWKGGVVGEAHKLAAQTKQVITLAQAGVITVDCIGFL